MVRYPRLIRTNRLLPIVLSLLIGACALTQPTDGEDEQEAKFSYTVNRAAWRYLDRAQRALAEKDLETAREELDDMRSREGRFNPYEIALMWQTYAHLYAEQENLEGAADALEQALVGETLPKVALIDTLYNVGSLQVALERYDKAADTFTRWLTLVGDNAPPTARYNAGVAYAQAKRFKEALEQGTLAVAATQDPPETWLQLLLSVQFELGNDKAVEANLKRLIVAYPKKVYWQQLASVYAARKDEPRTLAVLELMYLQGMLDNVDELTRVAQMAMFRGVPIKATRMIDQGLKQKTLRRDRSTLELLANSYLYARESDEAKGVLASAAKMSGDGDLYLQLARQQMRDAEWDEAASSVQRGIAKGQLKRVGEAYLLLGSIYFNAEQWNKALAAFGQAANDPPVKATAVRWKVATTQQIANARAYSQNRRVQ